MSELKLRPQKLDSKKGAAMPACGRQAAPLQRKGLCEADWMLALRNVVVNGLGRADPEGEFGR